MNTAVMHSTTTFTHETVPLDGEIFDGCEFRHCRLVYGGGEPPHFTGCRFEDCEWKMEGPAARTLEHLKVIWSAGAKGPVQGFIKDITGAR
jgi:hypothetical protein